MSGRIVIIVKNWRLETFRMCLIDWINYVSDRWATKSDSCRYADDGAERDSAGIYLCWIDAVLLLFSIGINSDCRASADDW